MLGNKRVVCVIPARLNSTRFPRKILALLAGKPLIQWVWEAASQVELFDQVICAVDAEETAAAVKGFGGDYAMTSSSCASGTDRLVELLGRLEGDIFVNWQGDEPFIRKEMIDHLLQTALEDGSDVWTLKKKICDEATRASPHSPKVVCDVDGYALYFSRCPIPYYRDPCEESDKIHFKHVGIYAFSRSGLEKIRVLPPCLLESAEQLEQLRYLYNGLRVRVHETQYEVLGIDLPEHLVQAEQFVNT